MPSNIDAINVYKENGILYGPAKAANAGGVAVSALEMSQNSQRLSWTREEVDGRLKDIMTNIFNTAKTTAETYGLGKDYLAGANIAAFEKCRKRDDCTRSCIINRYFSLRPSGQSLATPETSMFQEFL